MDRCQAGYIPSAVAVSLFRNFRICRFIVHFMSQAIGRLDRSQGRGLILYCFNFRGVLFSNANHFCCSRSPIFSWTVAWYGPPEIPRRRALWESDHGQLGDRFLLLEYCFQVPATNRIGSYQFHGRATEKPFRKSLRLLDPSPYSFRVLSLATNSDGITASASYSSWWPHSSFIFSQVVEVSRGRVLGDFSWRPDQNVLPFRGEMQGAWGRIPGQSPKSPDHRVVCQIRPSAGCNGQGG